MSLASCGGDDETSAEPVAPLGAPAVVEIYALDIWAQPLPEPIATLQVTHQGEPLARTGFPVSTVELWQPGSYRIELSAEDHATEVVTLTFDGSRELLGLGAELDPASVGHGLVVSHETREQGPTVHRIYLGLRHQWFSAQARPARRGNRIELFANGADAWSAVRADIEAAQDSILASTWSWESRFELTRDLADHHLLTESERRQNTILGLLEASGAHKRVVVGQFWGQDSMASWLTNDSELREVAEQPGDRFEFMGQGNPTEGRFWLEPTPFRFSERVIPAWAPTGEIEMDQAIPSNLPGRYVDLTEWPIELDVMHASYHQKMLVMDDGVAYLGGMNLRITDWDTAEHAVFEHRRMPFDASTAERVAVMEREELPATGPRRDYQVRIAGPAAQDVADVFHQRWEYLLQQEVDYADRCTPFDVGREIPAESDGLQVQVTTTLPEPFVEHGIAESWLNAIASAERFILIEDQYFRAPMLNELIIARMQEVPDLELVVITKPINEWTDPGCAQTAIANELFRLSVPSRYRTYQLRAFDFVNGFGPDETESRFAGIDLHAKMLIVDDAFMSVGSANKNNRGMLYEAEGNLAILDRAWVRAERRRLLASILPSGTTISDDVAEWIAALDAAAADNDAVYGAWEQEGWDINLNGDPLPSTYIPRGFVYGLSFGPLEDCMFESVGPDMMGPPREP
ncbi:MAG: hypothetical protein JRI23_05235 [Deltaproteobacteria bacterium]|nr:hypothetical protein [Deltaproteobacteria bacterium]MBW2530955.1 hypothetical protein [Deltaproteobacteria bacterium]